MLVVTVCVYVCMCAGIALNADTEPLTMEERRAP